MPDRNSVFTLSAVDLPHHVTFLKTKTNLETVVLDITQDAFYLFALLFGG